MEIEGYQEVLLTEHYKYLPIFQKLYSRIGFYSLIFWHFNMWKTRVVFTTSKIRLNFCHNHRLYNTEMMLSPESYGAKAALVLGTLINQTQNM